MAAISSHPPTIFDLARRLGVSKSTVSAALLGNYRISERTRARVRKLAAEVGYSRNAVAATLAAYGRSKPVRGLDVAIISHVPADGGYEFYDCSVIKERLNELGYEGHHYDIFHDGLSCSKLSKKLFNLGYQGIIFDQIIEKKTEVFSVDWGPLSLVCANRTHSQPPCDVVRGNAWQTVTCAWKEIRQAGYRRAGFVLSRHQPVMVDDEERESALWNCQSRLIPGEDAVPPYLGAIGNRAGMERWFHRHRPDVVVGFNSLHYRWLCEMGLRVPRDVAYVNLHADTADGGVAGVDQCGDERKIKTAEHLDFLIRHRRTGYPERPWELLGPIRWLPGKSLPVLTPLLAKA